ncbi:hypothetical protein BX616_001150 [Lobosporangium transversale]|nr:hypothetical protein BX616_001150 [Lobosporangium transversale]
MQDAVAFANCLYSMPDRASKSIGAAYERYYKQWYHRADAQIQRSKTLGKLTTEQQRSLGKMLEYRSQIAWLPLANNREADHVLPQGGSRKLFEESQQQSQVA